MCIYVDAWFFAQMMEKFFNYNLILWFFMYLLKAYFAIYVLTVFYFSCIPSRIHWLMMILAAIIIKNDIFLFILCCYCTLLNHYWISTLFFIEMPSKKANKLIVYGSLNGNYPYLSGKYIQLINKHLLCSCYVIVVIPMWMHYFLLLISCFIDSMILLRTFLHQPSGSKCRIKRTGVQWIQLPTFYKSIKFIMI